MTLNIHDEVIWLTRGRNWGSRFLSVGSFTPDEAFRMYQATLACCDDIPYSARGNVIRNGKHECCYFAQRFYDPVKRDAAGRRIIHEIIAVPRSLELKKGTSAAAFCSGVKEYYDRIFDCESLEVTHVEDTICIDFNDDEKECVVTKDVMLNVDAPIRGFGTARRFGWLILLTVVLSVAGALFIKDKRSPNELSPNDSVPKAVSHPSGQELSLMAQKLQTCEFLINKEYKRGAKVYLCLFSASWCSPCCAEMPRIAKTYAETLQSDPDIELIHFSCDQNDEKALAWARECDVKFPVVKPKGGNPIILQPNGIPHLFIVQANGTIIEEGHPMKLFTDETFRRLRR